MAKLYRINCKISKIVVWRHSHLWQIAPQLCALCAIMTTSCPQHVHRWPGSHRGEPPPGPVQLHLTILDGVVCHFATVWPQTAGKHKSNMQTPLHDEENKNETVSTPTVSKPRFNCRQVTLQIALFVPHFFSLFLFCHNWNRESAIYLCLAMATAFHLVSHRFSLQWHHLFVYPVVVYCWLCVVVVSVCFLHVLFCCSVIVVNCCSCFSWSFSCCQTTTADTIRAQPVPTISFDSHPQLAVQPIIIVSNAHH